jgi:hypothetical protein
MRRVERRKAPTATMRKLGARIDPFLQDDRLEIA